MGIEKFEAIVCSMGRKKMINVPANSKIKVGDRVAVEKKKLIVKVV